LGAKDTAPTLGLHTGYFDDRRAELPPDSRLHVVFKAAHAKQDGWTDDEHREFWVMHLGQWPGKRGNRSNVDSLAFVLAAGASDGFTFEEVAGALDGRTREDLRDRGVLELAERMLTALEKPPNPPDMPVPEPRDGIWSIPGPAHPHVIAASRLWRLPRVFALDDRGEEEERLPSPLAGWINLPSGPSSPWDFQPVGNGSIAAIEQGARALGHLREQRDSIDLVVAMRADVAPDGGAAGKEVTDE
jgi:hypothetical protein